MHLLLSQPVKRSRLSARLRFGCSVFSAGFITRKTADEFNTADLRRSAAAPHHAQTEVNKMDIFIDPALARALLTTYMLNGDDDS